MIHLIGQKVIIITLLNALVLTHASVPHVTGVPFLWGLGETDLTSAWWKLWAFLKFSTSTRRENREYCIFLRSFWPPDSFCPSSTVNSDARHPTSWVQKTNKTKQKTSTLTKHVKVYRFLKIWGVMGDLGGVYIAVHR